MTEFPPAFGVAPYGPPESSYDPRHYLQGVVAGAWQRAAGARLVVHVQGPWPTVSLYPDSYVAVVEGGADVLREFAGRPELARDARFAFSPSPRFRVDHPDMVAIDVLMWKLAVGASRGRLPVGADLETPCRMREWPNFTRLLLTPGALEIAALWTQYTCTVAQTIEYLRLPGSDVFAFYSAVAATGFLVTEEPPPQFATLGGFPAPVPASPPTAPPTGRASPRRGLLRTLFDKLRSN